MGDRELFEAYTVRTLKRFVHVVNEIMPGRRWTAELEKERLEEITGVTLPAAKAAVGAGAPDGGVDSIAAVGGADDGAVGAVVAQSGSPKGSGSGASAGSSSSKKKKKKTGKKKK